MNYPAHYPRPYYNSTFETTVRGGLKALVTFYICPPEPDIGCFYPYTEITEIKVWDKRKGDYRPAHWLEKQLSQAEYEALGEEALESVSY
jgi:hypothetical protein